MSNGLENCSVYVSSWDGYADLWMPYFNLFFKFWPECPYPVYLGVNEKEFSYPKVTTLKAAKHNNWSDRVREHLEQIKTKYVLMTLEDFFISAPVSSARIAGLLEKMEKLDGHCVRLVPDPMPDRALTGHYDIGLMSPGAHNRTNTHATIWRRESLLSLIRAGESLWEFEINGGVRSNRYSGGVFSVWDRVIEYDGVVDRGKWFPHFARKYRALNVGCDIDARGVKPAAEYLRWKFHRIVRPLINLMSLETRHHWRRILGHAK